MKSWLLLGFYFTFWACAFSQGVEKVVEENGKSLSYHYFADSKAVSTVKSLPLNNEKGYAKAYDKQGNEIYTRELSRSNLIQSVRFEYHSNGAIKMARYSWHPDGGIQRGGNTAFFDPQGKLLRLIDDENGPASLDKPSQSATTPPIKPTKPDCDLPRHVEDQVPILPLYETELLVINTTKKPMQLRVIQNITQMEKMEAPLRYTLLPGDTVSGGYYRRLGRWPFDPKENRQFELSATKEAWVKKVKLDEGNPKMVEVTPLHRKYFYEIQKGNKQ